MKLFTLLSVAVTFASVYAAPSQSLHRLEGRALETVSHVRNKTPVDPFKGPVAFSRAVEDELEDRSVDDPLVERDPKDNKSGEARAPIFTGDPAFTG